MRDNIPQEQKDIDGYYLITPNTSISMGYSRIVLLVREGVRLNILDDYMDATIPAITVKLISRGRKPIIIGGIYREFHLLLQPTPNTSDDMKLQIIRWRRTVLDWKRAARNNKCIVLGDINLDYMKWNLNDYRLKKLVQIVKDDIETEGFFQLLGKITRSWPGQTSSLVDHIWTNTPGSIMTTSNIVRAASDHNCISAVVRTKDRQEQEHEVTRRDRRKMDLERYKRRISNIDWTYFYLCRDINILNNIFVNKMGTILEEDAPLRTLQIRRNHKSWLSQDMKDQMLERDRLRESARTTGDAAQWRDYKKLRNLCTKNLEKQKIEHFRKLYEDFEKDHDTRNIFKTTRSLLNWKSGGSPHSLLVEGKLLRRPVELAEVQINYFTKKVEKLTRGLRITNTNPLKWLQQAMFRWENRGKFTKFNFN